MLLENISINIIDYLCQLFKPFTYERKLIVALFALFTCITHPLFAQKFDVDTLVYNGNSNQYINLVILGDGYTNAEMTKFSTDATKFKDYFFQKAPYSNYINYFNVFIIKTPSLESGVKHPGTSIDCSSAYPLVPISNPNNYFGTTFDVMTGYHRLVMPGSLSLVASVLANNFPNYDQVIILGNSPYYGGSGGMFATATLDTSSNEVAIHEIGHSFAGLADEYWGGSGYVTEKPNLTQNNNASTIKWKNWLTTGTGIGIYQFTGQSWYKPANGTCEMEYLNRTFCAVCTESIVEEIHGLVNPIKSYAPLSATNTISKPIYFSLNITKPTPNTIKTEWSLNGVKIGKNVDSVLINPASLSSGSNKLSVTVIDTTNLTRSNLHLTSHVYVTNWTISKVNTGIHDISSTNNLLEVKLYPNPSSDYLNVSYKTEKQEKISILVFSSRGTLVQSVTNQKWIDTENTLKIDLHNYPTGSYYIEFRTLNYVHTEKFIKK